SQNWPDGQCALDRACYMRAARSKALAPNWPTFAPPQWPNFTPPLTVVGKSLEILYPEGWPKRLTEYRDEIIAGRLTGFEAVRVAKDGSERQVWITCAPIRSPEGDVIAVSNIHRDVTELRKAEEARELITQEVIHRAKNMLTIVSSIQRQTARNATSLEDFHEKFGNRIAALSETTDMLVQGSWTTVALDRLVERHMAPFMQGVAHKVRVDGPVVELLPQAVQTIGMSLHELATNSAKYGALQTETGAIEITWRIEMGSTGQPQMRFEWLENGIHFRAPEGRSGFGQTVLTSLSQSMLNAEAAFEATPNSLRWKLAMPANHFRDLA
ncbi:sensor histidine kinase, partial [Donghicola sp. XS_ASV15]|uniref:sensor histidine kinase n=1 Tax=Donghicola sp. XS_ASV15 TaxID=3241295 RepID=UPI0035167EE9